MPRVSCRSRTSQTVLPDLQYKLLLLLARRIQWRSFDLRLRASAHSQPAASESGAEGQHCELEQQSSQTVHN